MWKGQKFERPKNRPVLIEAIVRILSVVAIIPHPQLLTRGLAEVLQRMRYPYISGFHFVDSRPFMRRGCAVGQKPRRNSVNPRGDGRFGSSTTLSHSASVLEAACPLEGFLRLGERSGQPELITKRHSSA